MKKTSKICAILLATLLLTGCGGASTSFDTAMNEEMPKEEAAVEYYDDVMEEIADTATTGGVSSSGEINQPAQTGRKLIRTFDINIQTKDFDEVMTGIQGKIQALGGYIEQSSLDSGSAYYSNYNRHSNMTVRIPSDKVDQFIENVKESANVTNISETAEDITLQYVDVESRKLALETERDRLLELLEKAETVEEIITIESRLSEVRYQLEAYTSTLRTYDNQVDYSTVYLNIHEVDRETKVEPKTFWEEVSENFGNSLYGIGRNARNFAIWFLGSLPILVLWAIFIGGGMFVIGCFRKKRKLKKLLRQTPPEAVVAPEENEIPKEN